MQTIGLAVCRIAMRIASVFRLSALFVLALCASYALPAGAQNFPTKPIRAVLPFSPGGAIEIIPRLLADRIVPLLGQPLVLEFRPGALGLNAINDVLGAPADGHTLMLADLGQWSITPAMQSVPYDFLRDFQPVSRTFATTLYIIVPAQGGVAKINTMQDLVTPAKARPGELAYASPGVGTLHQLMIEMLLTETGVKVRHIPYKGGSDAAAAALRGEVDFVALSYSLFNPHVQAGKMKIVASGSRKPFRLLPDVPSIEQQLKLRDFDHPGSQGIFVKAGTPRPIVDRLSEAVNKVLGMPEVAAKALEAAGAELAPSTPEQLADLVRSDIRKFTEAVRVSGAKAQ